MSRPSFDRVMPSRSRSRSLLARALGFFVGAAALALGFAGAAGAQLHPGIERGFAADRLYQFGDLESINPLNGNLVLRIPIGGEYPAGGSLAYNFTLSYNAKLWDFREVFVGGDPYNEAVPNQQSNAGFGWMMHLGRLIPPTDPWNPGGGTWVYESPDGGTHSFLTTLHGEADTAPGEATTFYTRDSTYLRMRDLGGGLREVDFPDGSIQQFAADGKLIQIRDRFNNLISVTYPSATLTRFTDAYGRVQNVVLRAFTYDGATKYMVDRVELTAFGTQTSTYTFGYTSMVVGRGDSCLFRPNPNSSSTVTLPMLTSITLPDGSTYQMRYYTDNPDLSCREGVISALTLPTLGKMEWSYQVFRLPAEGCSPLGYNRSPGVKTKIHKDAAGVELGRWEYTQTLSQPPPYDISICFEGFNPPPEESKTTVVSPLKDKTHYYFSVWPNLDNTPTGFTSAELGLPFTRFQSSGGRFLSTQTEDCDAAGANCVLKRSTYVSYEMDPIAPLGYLGSINRNRRLAGDRTVYHDDGGVISENTYSSFDGLGHYRQGASGGTFGAGDVRTVFTNYNPGVGTFPSAFTMLATTAPWVLGTSTYEDVSEGGVTARVETCFDAATGFLRRSRTLKNGTVASSTDVVSLFTPDARGHVAREQHYGGDVQAVGTGALCTFGLPATDQFRLDHTYQNGSLATSRWVDGAGTALSFTSVQRTIDLRTGMVASSTDAAGLTTDYEYDAMGRLTWSKPASGHGGWTESVYTRATGATALATLQIRRRGNGSKTAAVLAESLARFDGFGRLWREEELMPAGVWAVRETLYNALGWRASVSEIQTGNPNRRSEFLNYDPFGRPGIIRPADGSGHDVTLTYAGARSITSTFKVGTTFNAGTGNVDKTTVTTIGEFDRQGRTWKVTEPGGPNGELVTTRYEYDVGSRLSRVCALPVSGVCGQERIFTYDRRGFLTSERLPEKGAAGNGTVSYSGYNALGKTGRTIDGPSDLTYNYDRAGRLTLIRETGGTQRPLKDYVYGTTSAGGNWKNGQLEKASRYNYRLLGTIEYTGKLEEIYTYAGSDGRISRRDTNFLINGTLSDSFFQTFTYTPLGEHASLGYPQCVGCNAPAARTVSFTNTNGRLTAVPGFASAITYHPNGLYNQITHANGVVVTQANDPNSMLRPASINARLGTTTLWNTGTYSYDGAGNVLKMGTAWFEYWKGSRVKTGTLFSGATGTGTQLQQRYTYDGQGNMTSVTTQVGTATGTLRNTPTSATTNRLTAGATYDASGSMTSWNGATYKYDALGQLERMTNGTEDWVYVYTADDERVFSLKAGGTRYNRWTLRDLEGRVLREYLQVGDPAVWNVERDHVYRDGQLLAGVTPTGTVHYALDHLGSPRLVTNAAGATLAYHALYPFGEEATSPTQDTERMKFTVHERDLNATTGANPAADDLDYMHARFYNPQLARFLAADPVGGDPRVPQSWNGYSYVLNNPLRFIDPDGMVDECPSGFCETITVIAQAPGDRSFFWRIQFELQNLRYVSWSDFSFGRAASLSGQGFAAYTDGVIPFFDPLASLDLYDPDEVGMGALQVTGEVVATVVSVAGAAKTVAARAGSRAAPRIAPRACFTGQTLVLAAAGLVPIVDLDVGDLVWAKDERTGKVALQRVQGTVQREVGELVVLGLGGESVETTAEHPMWVVGRGWLPAGKLVVGDALLSRDGTVQPLASLERRPGTFLVHNLEVGGYHTFFVSSDEVLVHNKAMPRKPGSQGKFKGSDALRRENKVVRDVSKKLKLSKDQQRQLHDEISGQGLDYHGILDAAKGMFGQ